MPIKRENFISFFIEELDENINILNKGIIKLKKNPDDKEELTLVTRALHTVKGSARMLDLFTIEKVAHNMENIFTGIVEKQYELTDQLVQLLFIGTDYFKYANKVIKATGEDNFEINKFVEACEKAAKHIPFSLEGIKPEDLNGAGEAEVKPKEEPGEQKEPVVSTDKGEIELFHDKKEESAPIKDTKKSDKAPATKIKTEESIKVKVNKIDTMIAKLNDIITNQFQFKKDNELINEIEDKFAEILSMQSINEKHQKDVTLIKKEKGLLKLIQNTRKNFSEQESLIERLTFELQEELVGLRMLPLEMILGSLERMVAQTAMSIQKEINLSITGMDVMIDRAILEKINDPIIHLVRNSVDHGIEMPDEREKKGKPREGSINIHCYHEGGNIFIKIKDDGKGIDYDRIRQKAMAMEPGNAEKIKELTDNELNNYLFKTGFSTKQDVTKLSGRGVGMDIVKFNIEKVKGKILLHSVKDKGTEFTLTLPLSLATIEGFFIEESGKKFFFPANYVKEIIILDDREKIRLLEKKVFKLRDTIIPLYNLAHMLQLKNIRQRKDNFVIVTELLGELVGISVHRIIEYSSLIFKPLPKSLQKLSYVQGIVFDENFNVITILYIPAILERYKASGALSTDDAEIEVTTREKTILVVDDSLNTREIEKSIFELEDYKVITAVDGLDGLNKLKKNHIDLVVSDVVMPNMDGFGLTENIRNSSEFKDLPVILVTSQEDKKDKERGLGLGANAYIAKSNFDRKNLLDEVNKLLF